MSLRLSRNLLATLRPSFRPRQLGFSAYPVSPARKGSTLQWGHDWQRPLNTSRWLGVAASVGLGLAASAVASPIYCEPITPVGSRPTSPAPEATAPSTTEEQGVPEKSTTPPPPPSSAVNLYELSFGTVAGICAGVFIKKGAKAVAFFVGGVFVLLQYFNSLSLIRIDWARAGTKFENLFYTTDANGIKRAPTVGSLWRWLVEFLTADFQPRASFLAGLALGLRIG